MSFSHVYDKVLEAYGIDAIRKVYEASTAELYGDVVFCPRRNEQLLGKAVEGVRQEIVLATKMHFRPEELADGTTVYEALRRHLERSMRNQRIDYVDFCYLTPRQRTG